MKDGKFDKYYNTVCAILRSIEEKEDITPPNREMVRQYYDQNESEHTCASELSSSSAGFEEDEEDEV